LRVALFQFAPVFGEKERNIERLLTEIEDSAFDILVLPELFATGYQFHDKDELRSLAESVDGGLTVRRLVDVAKEKGCLVVAGMAELAGGKVYNSAVLVEEDGVLGVYRKIHLFEREKELFEAGEEPPEVFSFGGVRVGVMICFDWIYPEVARTLALGGAQIIAHPTNLVIPFLCQRAMFARAVENRIFTVTANRVGEESRVEGKTYRFTGRSVVYSPRGELLVELSGDEERLAVVEIEPEEALNKQVTEKNHLFADRRPALYLLD